MGILVIAWAAMLIFLAAIFIFIFVFIPCLIIFITNLVKAIKNKWPKNNTVAVVITGIVLSVIISVALAFCIMVALANANSEVTPTSDSSIDTALQYLLSQINH